MSQLSANKPRVYGFLSGPGAINNLPIKASTEIWLGSVVGMTAGYARQLVSGDVFGGFADQHINNDIATDGAKTVPVKQSGLIELTITGVAVTDIDAPVYASDGDTFTLTAGANTYIGKVHRYVSSNTAIVSYAVSYP